MKKIISLLFLMLVSISNGQQTITSGNYEYGLKIAYNSDTHKLTGYFEDYNGEDHKFSCVFFIEGTQTETSFKIKTYFPNDGANDVIEGTLTIVDNETLSIKLNNDHGGCWNVQNFSNEPIVFKLLEKINWIQIGYIVANQSYFFKDKNNSTKLKSYLIKNNFVCIEKIENEWAYCSYFGDTTTKGWIKLKDLNIYKK